MPSSLHITAPDRRHADGLFDLIGKAFPGEGYWRFSQYARESYIGRSHYDWAASRVGMLDGQVVTHYGVWGYDMRIGTAIARCGGIGAVATHGDYRGRRLMDGTARASIEAMRHAGYDCTVLFGIENFYHKFGYVRAWPDSSITVKVSDLPTEAPLPRPRRFAVRNRADINALYNAAYATVTGSAVRPTFGNLGYPGRLEGLRWDGGYVMVIAHGANLECVEAVGDPGQCLRVLSADARRRGSVQVKFHGLPWDSPVPRLLRQGNCRVESGYERSGGAMIRVLNLGAMLGKMSGELTRRLEASTLAGWRGALRLASPDEAVTLHLADGAVTVGPDVDTPHALAAGWPVAQLLLGTESADETIDAYLPATGDAMQVCRALFPKQDIALAMYDRY
jgi:predicted N-acetyltransferase YhbS